MSHWQNARSSIIALWPCRRITEKQALSAIVITAYSKMTTILYFSHWAHDVVATLNQRQWRWFNVATTSCDQCALTFPRIICPSVWWWLWLNKYTIIIICVMTHHLNYLNSWRQLTHTRLLYPRNHAKWFSLWHIRIHSIYTWSSSLWHQHRVSQAF